MNVSNRISNIDFSPIRKLTPYADEAASRGVEIIHLNIGQPDIRTPLSVYEGFRGLASGTIAYGPSDGDPRLKSALASYYRSLGLSVKDGDILVTTGGSEALAFAFSVFCDPGDEALVTEPFYTNILSMARAASVELAPVASRIEDGFRLPSIEEFERAITPRTRLVLLNNPNNPTGHVYTSAELLGILDLCARRDLVLVVDEVYRDFCYDGKKAVSILSFPGYEDRVVCVDSFSKRYSMCGARIGAVISKNRGYLAQFLKLAQARLCAPVLEQEAALRALSTPQSAIEAVRQEYERRRDFLIGRLARIPGVVCPCPGGSFYMLAQLPVDDAEAFSIFMLRDFSHNNRTVMMAPASGFYIDGSLGRSQVRLAYVLETSKIEEAMVCLEKGLEAYNSRLSR